MEKDFSEIIIYKIGDGLAKVNVYFSEETAWLTQKQIAQVFDIDRSVVTKHLKNIFISKELERKSNVQKMHIPNSDKAVEFYNLNAIISVGYRVNSKKATQFRIWATKRLHEYIIKGFTLDDERLKQGGGRSRYFDELLQRIRDIRSSERNFYQKVTDIYTTSIDYKKDHKLTETFFATVQNKIHYAIHGHTAAEIISSRVDSKKPMLGLTNFKGKYITSSDVKIAKNYLSEKELKELNLIVSLYLDFAELQATNERPMKMIDWISKLDEFLKLSEKKLLKNSGKISSSSAFSKADKEFEKYKIGRNKKLISDFDRVVKKIAK